MSKSNKNIIMYNKCIIYFEKKKYVCVYIWEQDIFYVCVNIWEQEIYVGRKKEEEKKKDIKILCLLRKTYF